MDLIRFVISALLSMALVSVPAAEQPDLSKKHAASLVYACLSAGECTSARMLNISKGTSSYYEINARQDGIAFSYVVPINERRLEVHVIAEEYELTFIDADVDGVVDQIIHISAKNNTAIIYGRQYLAEHTKAQELYMLGLRVAIHAFILPQRAEKK